MNLPHYIKITQLLVIFTMIFAMLLLDWKKPQNRLLLLILWVCSLTEIVSSIFVYYRTSIGAVYSVSIILHDVLWLTLLLRNTSFSKNIRFLPFVFFALGCLNLLALEGSKSFNSYTFVLGSLLFIIIYLLESFKQLKSENFYFFSSSSFMLLSAPMLFYFGLSFAFSFKSKLLLHTFIGEIILYDLLIYSVNIIYYTLINIYVYRERRLRHAG